MNQLFVILEDTGPDLGDIGAKLVPNVWAFLTQFLAFIVMVLIVIKLAYKPVHKYLEARKAYVRDNLENAAKSNREAAEAAAQAKANLNDSKRQGSDIVMAAKKQAEEDKARYEEELKEELKAKRTLAEKDIEAEKRQALIDAQGQIVDIALAASASLLGREVSTDDNKKYVAGFVKDVSEGKKTVSSDK
jgi:F-type H+-transporting ATPase subunit b